MSGKTLFFVRHGEAGYNLLDRVNSHPEVRNDLTVTGREQAACCRTALASAAIEVIYCSEFARARQTADIINQDFGVPVVIDRLINETGAFAFEGLPCSAWHRAQVPDRMSAVVPGCESFGEMKSRLLEFLDRLHEIPQQRILVVSHEEPIQLMLGMLEGVPDGLAKTRPISHCMPISMDIKKILI
ncbi:MAG: histidine phosphatase family protein [Sulfurimicrobium sp.]|nr:histidine phosphatase family protein [Sulfurimicrobium sp.]MDP2962819.1 histidine phosphatase family protein [Sulfurimicrobium sp.]MDZ7655791.1 histidine phosphatase family protein [Sulfurimicrobium sp.]